MLCIGVESLVSIVVVYLLVVLFLFALTSERRDKKKSLINNYVREKVQAAHDCTRRGKPLLGLSGAIDLVDAIETRTTWRLCAGQAIVVALVAFAALTLRSKNAVVVIIVFFTSWVLSTMSRNWERMHGYAPLTEGVKCIIRAIRGEPEDLVGYGPLWYEEHRWKNLVVPSPGEKEAMA